MTLIDRWAHHPLLRACKLNRLACQAHQIAVVRERALHFLIRHPDSLDLCFCASVFEAQRLVANKILRIHYRRPASNSHSSRVPIAVLIQRKPPGAQTWFFDPEEVDSWILNSGCQGDGLFIQKVQSPLDGRRTPMRWYVPSAHSKSLTNRVCRASRIRWAFSGSVVTLLDASELASTAVLDFASPQCLPDFISFDLSTLFGFPNAAALVMRKQTKAWSTHQNTVTLESRVPFHSILAANHALDVYEGLFGRSAMALISANTSRLAEILYVQLQDLRHSNDRPLCRLYKNRTSRYEMPETQGPLILFNLQRADGMLIEASSVVDQAQKSLIHLGTVDLAWPVKGELKNVLAMAPRIYTYYTGALMTCLQVCIDAAKAEWELCRLLRFLKSAYLSSSRGVGNTRVYTCPVFERTSRPEPLTSMSLRARAFRELGWWDDAAELEMKVLDGRKSILGDRHPLTIASLANLARSREYDR